VEPDELKELAKEVNEISKMIGPWCPCPKCGAEPKDQEVRNYDMMWGDGDVYCKKCGAYVRSWDRD